MFDANYTLMYTLYAFKTEKGIFTLVGTSSDGIDTFKNINTGTYHDFPRQSIKKWFLEKKIIPIQEALNLMWYKSPTIDLKELNSTKTKEEQKSSSNQLKMANFE